MAEYRVSSDQLVSVANAIRTKGETSSPLSFPDGFVTAIGNIPTGGSATLVNKTITQNGTYDPEDDNADGYSEVTVSIPNIHVTGTFTGTTAGETLNITLPYVGSGYPVAVTIYPTDGPSNSSSVYYTTIQRRAICCQTIVKDVPSVSPDYTSGNVSANYGTSILRYKSSTSDATEYSVLQASGCRSYGTGDIGGSSHENIRFSSSINMKVLIADTSYGFMKDIEYTYQVVYSA